MSHPYAAAMYADALSFLGRPIRVEEWGAFVLARKISGGGEDALGVYPRTPICERADLAAGMERLRDEGFVSVAVVPDPLFAPDTVCLARAFDVCRPFKTHLLMERARGFPV